MKKPKKLNVNVFVILGTIAIAGLWVWESTPRYKTVTHEDWMYCDSYDDNEPAKEEVCKLKRQVFLLTHINAHCDRHYGGYASNHARLWEAPYCFGLKEEKVRINP